MSRMEDTRFKCFLAIKFVISLSLQIQNKGEAGRALNMVFKCLNWTQQGGPKVRNGYGLKVLSIL